MGFQDKLKKTVSKGLEHSKQIFSVAKDKAKELGDAGILRFEIHQLEDKLKKQEQLFGHTVYALFADEGKQSLTRRSAGVKDILEIMEDLHNQLAGKKAALEDAEADEKRRERKSDGKDQKEAGSGSTLDDQSGN